MLQETKQPSDGPIQKHVSATYYTLRWGLAALGIAFPFVLWIGGRFYGLPLQDSMSHYYHANTGAQASGAMRDGFVGFLFALGALLYLYKGFTKLENVLLNAAGALAVGVAVFPMAWPPSDSAAAFSLHGACAVLAFVCLAVVAWVTPERSLRLMEDEAKRRRYRAFYRAVAIFMFVFPIVAWVTAAFLGITGKWIFVMEALGLLGFLGYWVAKSLEMSETQAEGKALRGLLISQQGRA